MYTNTKFMDPNARVCVLEHTHYLLVHSVLSILWYLSIIQHIHMYVQHIYTVSMRVTVSDGVYLPHFKLFNYLA